MKMGGLGLSLIGPQDKAMSKLILSTNLLLSTLPRLSKEYFIPRLPNFKYPPSTKYALEPGDNSDEAIDFMYTSNC